MILLCYLLFELNMDLQMFAKKRRTNTLSKQKAETSFLIILFPCVNIVIINHLL